MADLIEPHGGKLVNRTLQDKEKEGLKEKLRGSKQIHLNKRELSDLEMIADGAFSPLEGFMVKEEYQNVLVYKRLANGLPWTIPITLSVSNEQAGELKEGDDIALLDDKNLVIGALHLEEKYPFDKDNEAVLVYGTDDTNHPGVSRIHQMGDVLLGGKISVVKHPPHEDFIEYRLTPMETRKLFKDQGWRRIVGFQTRNPIHRAHEYLQKCALEIVDALFIHPIVGEVKSGDIPAEVRMRCYEVLLENYYPKDRVLLVVNPAAMRYAGPCEAVFHAIIRKNYGCTHFIVGRDHAGVGSYYGPYDAHCVFDQYMADELGITPLFFDNAFYCRKCLGMASYKTCPHDSTDRLSLSGTNVRGMLKAGKMPPAEITRPEVAKVLIESMAKGKNSDV